MNEDLQHLKLLSIFHYVVGGLAALFACFPIIHLFAACCILSGWALAVCVIFAGRYLSRRIHHTFCLIMAGLECMFMPLGTVLGVLTIIVLVKPSVKELFAPGEK